jgi:hypothetical protein
MDATTSLEAGRQELLYSGLGNLLINYRHYVAGGVEVVGERPIVKTRQFGGYPRN